METKKEHTLFDGQPTDQIKSFKLIYLCSFVEEMDAVIFSIMKEMLLVCGINSGCITNEVHYTCLPIIVRPTQLKYVLEIILNAFLHHAKLRRIRSNSKRTSNYMGCLKRCSYCHCWVRRICTYLVCFVCQAHATNLLCRKTIKMDSLMLFMFYDPISYEK